MDQRLRFIAKVESGAFTMTELCREFGISRQTGYKWAQRYAEEGIDGLKDRSRAPESCPHRTSRWCEEALIEARRKHPRWGPRKLLRVLWEGHPDRPWPAPSTAGDLLKRHGLVEPRRRRRQPLGRGRPMVEATEPNDLWTTDFKGQFRMGDGQLCYPLTVADRESRFLLGCQGKSSVASEGVHAEFDRLFAHYGLPRRILSDNGSPFASARSPQRLSRLSVWWIKLGIEPVIIQPGHPEQNGAHERMHRTLKAETARPPAASMRSQQRSFDDFCREFNHERPHEALDMKRPADRYTSSSRRYTGNTPDVEYPGHYEVRRVQKNGDIKWRGRLLFVSTALAGERLGLEEVDDGLWSLCFGPVLLGRYDAREQATEFL